MSGQIQYVVTRSLTSGTTDHNDELEEAQAARDATSLEQHLAVEGAPIMPPAFELHGDDACHFVAPVRFGRRRADQVGHLELTRRLLRFHGALDVSIVWEEIADVRRSGRDIQVSLTDSERMLRFDCHTLDEAVRGSVIARYLLGQALSRSSGDPPAEEARL